MLRSNRTPASISTPANKGPHPQQNQNTPSTPIAPLQQSPHSESPALQENASVVAKKAEPPVFDEIESSRADNLKRWSVEHKNGIGFLGKAKAIFNGGRNFPAAVQYEPDDRLGHNLGLAMFDERFARYREQPDPIQLARAVALVEEVRDFHKSGVDGLQREKLFPAIQSKKLLHKMAIDSYLSSMHEEIPRETLEASAAGQHSGLYHRGLGITASVLKPGISIAGVAGGTTGLVTALAINTGLTVGGTAANLRMAASMRRFTKGKEPLAPHLVPVPAPSSKAAPDVRTSASMAKDYGKQSMQIEERLATAIEKVKQTKAGNKPQDYEAAMLTLKDTAADAQATIDTQNKIKSGMQNAATEFNGNRENIITGVAVSVGLTAGTGVAVGTHGLAAPVIHLVADAVSAGAAASMYSAYHFLGGPQREGKKKFNDILLNNLKSPDMLAAKSPMTRTQVAESYGQYLRDYRADLKRNNLSEDSPDDLRAQIEKTHAENFRAKLDGVFDYDKVNGFSIKPVTQRVDLAKKLLQGKLALELERALPYTKPGEPNTVPVEIREATGQLLSDLANITEAEKCIRDATLTVPASDRRKPDLTPEQDKQLRLALNRSAEILDGIGDEHVKLLFTGKLRDQLDVQYASTELMMLEAERYEWTVHGGGVIAEIAKDALVAGDVAAAGFGIAHVSHPADIGGDVLNTANKLVDNSVKPSGGEAGAIRNTLQKSDIVRDIREKSMSDAFRKITETEMHVPPATHDKKGRVLQPVPPYTAQHFNLDPLFDGKTRIQANTAAPQDAAAFYIPKALHVPGAGKVSLGDTKAYFTQVGKSPADVESKEARKVREKKLDSLLRSAYWGPAVDTLASLPRRFGIKAEMTKGRNSRRKIEQELLGEAKQLIKEYDEA